MSITNATQKINYLGLTFGADPEFFFQKKKIVGKGPIVGAEKYIPSEGVAATSGKIIIDGVQAEINVNPDTCRQRFANNISRIMRRVQQEIKNKRVEVNWDVTVNMTKTEMRSLSDKNKVFGCSPSLNAYGEEKTLPDANVYLYRSAGGHIHIGNGGYERLGKLLDKGNLDEIVKVLDIIVGNTCVLVDRDAGNIERRKCYGRAGEYRAPKRNNGQGLEYRVLSNFWLKNYKLMSMAFGLTRLALGFAESPKAKKELMAAVSEEDIRNAINNNDFALAKANYEKIKPLIVKYAQYDHTLNATNLAAFDYFVNKGIKVYFRTDPLKHWSNTRFNALTDDGFERFLNKIKRTQELA